MTIYTRHQTPPTPADPPGPAGLWMPWYTGLGEVCTPCICIACLGNRPSSVNFTVAGVVNFACTDCANLNGTWTANYSSVWPPGSEEGCVYQYFDPVVTTPKVCNSSWRWRFLICYNAGLGRREIRAAPVTLGASPLAYWRRLETGVEVPFDCDALVGMTLPVWANGSCGNAGSTFTINSIT